MTALALLEEMTAAGVKIRVIGADLAIRPKGILSDDLRAKLLAGKPQLMALLTEEITWRVSVLKTQIPAFPAPIPALSARPERRPGPDECQCCGDPVPPDPAGPGPQQCGLCVEAIRRVIATRQVRDWPGTRPTVGE